MIAPPKKGGLGIGSLQASNLAMLTKWWWRFRVEPHALWRKMIKSIHGNDGGLSYDNSMSRTCGPWSKITKLQKELQKHNINLWALFRHKLGNGCDIKFWKDLWVGGETLETYYSHLFGLERYQNASLMNRCHCSINDNGPINYRWAWKRSIRTGIEREEFNDLLELLNHLSYRDCADSWEFTVDKSRSYTIHSMRKLIDSITLPFDHMKLRWNKFLPGKININTWRTRNERLPTSSNLDKRGSISARHDVRFVTMIRKLSSTCSVIVV